MVQTAEGSVRPADGALPRDRASGDQHPPEITVAQAMAELDDMIGLTSVKDQIRQITASVEAARRRVMAGYGAEKPMQHFVFLGPPGTGKTSVARVVAKIFYAFGLLDTPLVVEAQRADLVGEYLGATAIKTNELVNSALGGVLFIDEAYSLVNDSEGQGDRFGHEAIQALLKRAEDDRTELIIILAGYEKQMEGFLASNPGLNSRFGLRVKFPTYSPAELMALAELYLEQRGEILEADARPALWRMMEDVGRRRLADELGNGRFVRSLLEKAGRARDVRIMADGAEPSAGRAGHPGGGRPGAGRGRAHRPVPRLQPGADPGERPRRAGRAGRPGAGQAPGARDRRPAAGGPAAGTASACPASPRSGTSCSPGRPARARPRWPGSSAASSPPWGCWSVPR